MNGRNVTKRKKASVNKKNYGIYLIMKWKEKILQKS